MFKFSFFIVLLSLIFPSNEILLFNIPIETRFDLFIFVFAIFYLMKIFLEKIINLRKLNYINKLTQVSRN